MFFKVLDRILDVETIASGKGIRERRRLQKLYGGRRWRKLKGTARVKLADGTICHAEVHWYEAHGIGARELKIKRILETQ
ncbi:MAG: hypothetical protein WAN60_21605 [Candidatus Sulfotelmatobacter sp.]